mmetsp:Transcript_7467/g.9326  ORF Transcript_7467/g.9326 Transcript_7467/m.9326 type:complete len:87 (+) Transcript_7467:289-549(+)
MTVSGGMMLGNPSFEAEALTVLFSTAAQQEDIIRSKVILISFHLLRKRQCFRVVDFVKYAAGMPSSLYKEYPKDLLRHHYCSQHLG